MPKLLFSEEAAKQYGALEADKGHAKRFKAVRAALGKMETNLRHPGLNTHEFKSQPCPHGEKLYEAYAENKTAAAYRIFWCYDRNERNQIVIVAITEHP